jgi:riboflavin kinase/FMN adenylyltransferase
MKQIVCGSDFRFGYKREGDVNYLLEEADRYGYLVKVFDKLQENSAIISSTRIRHLIEEGNVEEANKLLNHPYRIKGKVIHGNEIGRTLNYPTANVVSEVDKILPAKGVYFTKTYYNGKLYDSITNVGNRPTVVDDNKIVIETHILDFEGEIYDEYIEILFYMYHRKEQKFSSRTELAENLKKDAVIRRKYQFA